jgi:subtilisin-like proprotein convertase family protein
MDEIRKSFLSCVSRARYAFMLTGLAAFAVAGFLMLPDGGTVSAQESDAKSGQAAQTEEVATQAMLDFALNLKSASEYTVYAERGIVKRGESTIKGRTGDALRTEAGRKATRELGLSIDAIRQLPCSEVKGTDLTGRSFTPGVYCLSSAELDGEMVLDGGGNMAGTYVFRVGGTLNAKAGASVRLENGAQSGNVFFVAENAELAEGAVLRANVLTRGDITMAAGSTITNKALALGTVTTMDQAHVAGGTTGTMEICKAQAPFTNPANDLSNRIFNFVVTGAVNLGTAANPVRVAVGSCSAPFDVTQGPQTVTELNTGQLITPSTGTFSGGFQLINVQNLTPGSTSTLGLVNLSTRVANVNIVAGGVPQQLTLRFTNRAVIIGFIEICKRAATGPTVDFFGGAPPPSTTWNPGGTFPNLTGGDPDVTGYFQFTIEDVYTVNTLNPNVQTLQIFTVPVGQCTGPIAVTVGNPEPGGNPRSSFRFITEIGRPGFYLESVQVIPPDRLITGPILGQGVGAGGGDIDTFYDNPGGGWVDVRVVESATSANETLVIFANRSNPGLVKVCKIAGPGIPVNTLFTYTVHGWGATNAAPPQFATYGFVTRTFDVRAGDPATGGSCTIVPGFGANPPGYAEFQTFMNGTPVYIFENGVSVNNTIPQLPGELRASLITVDGSTFVPAGTLAGQAGFSPNPDLTPAAATTQVFSTPGPIAINDLTTINIPVNVPIAGLVTDVDVLIRLDHTFDGDLILSVLDPFGRQVVLSQNRGGGGDNFGTGANDCTGTPTTFDDEAPTPISAGVAPFSGSFRPEGLLSTFDGRGMNGTWQIRIADVVGGDSGTVGCVSLRITSSAYVARAAVFARASMVEVTFVNFRFNPAQLKVCKIAGPGVAQGTNFTFDVALVSPVGVGPGGLPFNLFPAFTVPVTVQAGPADNQEGFCTFVNGTGLLGGAFNQGQTYTITERAQAGAVVTAITCPSCNGGLGVDLPNRRATLNGPGGMVAGINAVVFTNSAPPVVQDAARFDYDGDRKADPSVFTPATATWKHAASSENGLVRSKQFGNGTDKLVPADYDGDGKTDHAVWRDGRWFFLGTTNVYEYHDWGQAGDIPLTGDFDGDGKADFAIFRPSNGTWYIKQSRDGFRIFQFGIQTDKPYTADYDGDGRTDVSVFRNGTWYTLESTRGFRVTEFGAPGDIPVPADYDGDHQADIAVFRAGTWFIRTATSYSVHGYGLATDKPVPDDYDGDGRTDLAVYRPSEGKWYIRKSNQSEPATPDTFTLGGAGDSIIPAAN